MPPARALVLETSTRPGGVALAESGRVVAKRELVADRRHASDLLPAIHDLLRSAGWTPRDLGAVFFSQGPGSFTGLRIAATVARLLQWTRGCDVVAVPTLAAIARGTLAAVTREPTGAMLSPPQQRPLSGTLPRGESMPRASRTRRIAVILDAGRAQVYGALYEPQQDGTVRTVQDVAVRDPSSWFASIAPPFRITGEGVSAHRDACAGSRGVIVDERFWTPTVEHVLAVALEMLRAGRVCRPAQIVPLYVRRPEAEEVYEQRRAAARRRRGE